MSAQKNKNHINLLPEANFESTTTGRVLSWILSTFRIIVIVTEIIVMIAFLSRFWLDAQNTDLNDEIENKTAVLVNLQNFEKEFKDTQNRLKIFSELTKNQGVYSDILNTLVSYLPQDLYLTTATLNEGMLQIEGSTSNEVSIQQLMVNLLSTNKFTEVTLNELASNPKDPYIFNFKLGASFLKKEEL
jgi:Tfp pilus assembly protein PilN